MRVENGRRLSVHLSAKDVTMLEAFCTENGSNVNISDAVRQLARASHIITAIKRLASK
jgi:hypothetical protein